MFIMNHFAISMEFFPYLFFCTIYECKCSQDLWKSSIGFFVNYAEQVQCSFIFHEWIHLSYIIICIVSTQQSNGTAKKEIGLVYRHHGCWLHLMICLWPFKVTRTAKTSRANKVVKISFALYRPNDVLCCCELEKKTEKRHLHRFAISVCLDTLRIFFHAQIYEKPVSLNQLK